MTSPHATTPSYSAVPCRLSTVSPPSTPAASVADVEKSVSCETPRPNEMTEMRSPDALCCTKDRAASEAFESDWPFIERDVSIATTTLFDAPRFTASNPLTGVPFSVSRGVVAAGFAVTTLTTRRG